MLIEYHILIVSPATVLYSIHSSYLLKTFICTCFSVFIAITPFLKR